MTANELIYPALRCCARALSMVALILREATPQQGKSVRADLELLYFALEELVDVFVRGKSDPIYLPRLRDRLVDIDDEFTHGTEYYRIVMLSMVVWEMREATNQSAMRAALEHAVEFIRELPLEQDDTCWRPGSEVVPLDDLEEQRQSHDVRYARKQLDPWEFTGLPPLVDAYPTQI